MDVGIDNYSVFIISTVISFMSYINAYITVEANYWPLKAKLLFGLFGVLGMGMRLVSMTVYFIPSLGLFDTLRHFQVA